MDCKTAGASGRRNSRIKSIASVLEGLTALTRWVQTWISACVPDDMAHEWRVVLGIPLRKGSDGQDVRPILIGESLMSLPGACLQHIVQAKVKKLLHPSQFGISMVAGAESMIMLCKALAKLNPEDAFAAFDMVNAFGEISRAEVLEEVIDTMPELAPFLVQVWGGNGTQIFSNISACTWEEISLFDGLFQGHNLSSVLFCLGLKRALKRFELDGVDFVLYFCPDVFECFVQPVFS